MDRLKVMETFARVIGAGSFSAAASQMGVSQAIVTKHVAQLESALGVRLLNRTTRRLSLTEVGRDYYAFCTRILDDIRLKECAVRQLHDAPTGEIKLLAPKSFGSLHVAKAVSTFMTRHPKIHVSLFLGDSSMHSLGLVENGFDLAIRLAPQPDSSVTARRIGTARWIACASPAYLDQHGEPTAPADLSSHQCLVNKKSHQAWRFTKGARTQDVKIIGEISTNSVIVLRQAALDGHGIALLPIYCIEDDLATGRLRHLFQNYTTPDEPIWAIFPHRNLVPRKIRLFIDFMIDWLRSDYTRTRL